MYSCEIAVKSKKIVCLLKKIRQLAEIQQTFFVNIDKLEKYDILYIREINRAVFML